MHELKIAQELTAIITEVADRERLSEVTTVNIVFGRMVQVVPEIFNFAFRECVRETIACNAGLNIEILPVKVRCRECSSESPVEGYDFSCVVCGSADTDLVQGREIYVKSIEGE